MLTQQSIISESFDLALTHRVIALTEKSTGLYWQPVVGKNLDHFGILWHVLFLSCIALCSHNLYIEQQLTDSHDTNLYVVLVCFSSYVKFLLLTQSMYDIDCPLGLALFITFSWYWWQGFRCSWQLWCMQKLWLPSTLPCVGPRTFPTSKWIQPVSLYKTLDNQAHIWSFINRAKSAIW